MKLTTSVYAADAPLKLQDMENVFIRIIGMVLGFAGIALFIMLTVSGFNYLTAGADPAKAEAAKRSATSAVLGLVLISASYFVLFLISGFLGVPEILNFKIFIPTP